MAILHFHYFLSAHCLGMLRKYQLPMLALPIKALLRPSFHTVMMPRKHGYYDEENPSAIDGKGRRAEDVTERKALIAASN